MGAADNRLLLVSSTSQGPEIGRSPNTAGRMAKKQAEEEKGKKRKVEEVEKVEQTEEAEEVITESSDSEEEEQPDFSAGWISMKTSEIGLKVS
jgi:hypothetical protein